MKEEFISITKEAFVELIDSAFKMGYSQALEILQTLQATSGFTEEQKDVFIKLFSKEKKHE